MSLKAFLLEIRLQLSPLWCIPIVKAVLKNNGLSPLKALSDFLEAECSWLAWISVGAGSQTRLFQKVGKQKTVSGRILPVSAALGG